MERQTSDRPALRVYFAGSPYTREDLLVVRVRRRLVTYAGGGANDQGRTVDKILRVWKQHASP